MDPFRDELAAAHAKIAQLEERVNHLQGALRTVNDVRNAQTMPARQRADKTRPQSQTLLMVFIIIAMMILGAATAFVTARVHAASTGAATYKGVAIAQPPQTATVASPTVDPTSSSKANAKPCNCTPGDPLCSCL